MALLCCALDDVGATMRDENVFKEARLVARHCIEPTRRDILRAYIDLAKADYDIFCLSPTHNTMQSLVASWTRMCVALEAMPPIGSPDDPAGRLPLSEAS